MFEIERRKEKERLREELRKDVEAYFAKGGKTTYLGAGQAFEFEPGVEFDQHQLAAMLETSHIAIQQAGRRGRWRGKDFPKPARFTDAGAPVWPCEDVALVLEREGKKPLL